MIYDKLPIVFLGTIASEKKDSTNSQIASYILDHLEDVSSMGIKEMAKQCHVAVSSISRFCKEIGLQDYAELRELLQTTHMTFQDNSSSKEQQQRLEDYSVKVKSSIDMVKDSVDMNAIGDLCQDIHDYKNVSIFGLLKAGSVALNLQGDLLMLGKQTYTSVSYHQQIQNIKSSTKDDLIIIFSYTGSYFDYQDLRSDMKKLDAPKIWFISGQHKTFPMFINRVILFDSVQDQTSHPYQLQFIAGLIGQEYSYMFHNV